MTKDAKSLNLLLHLLFCSFHMMCDVCVWDCSIKGLVWMQLRGFQIIIQRIRLPLFRPARPVLGSEFSSARIIWPHRLKRPSGNFSAIDTTPYLSRMSSGCDQGLTSLVQLSASSVKRKCEIVAFLWSKVKILGPKFKEYDISSNVLKGNLTKSWSMSTTSRVFGSTASKFL